MIIKGNKVRLRAMELSDSDLVRNMFNDPELENLVVGWAFPISDFSQKKWLENNYKDTNNFRFIIESDEDGVIGVATLTNIDWKNRSATHGIKLAKVGKRSKGLGTDSNMAILKYAFDELGLNRLDASWLTENVISRQMFMKCGWVEEGIKRNCIYKAGKFHDLIVGGILADEYYELIKKNHYWDIER